MSKHETFEALETGTTWQRIARAIGYLSGHYLEQPSLEKAAEAASLSPHHFQRLFTRYVGISPKSFVANLTLDHARKELAAGVSVLDAALDAGLSGPSRLHDLALKIEAMTPGEYAKGGEGLTIEYGFHDSPFGLCLIMATSRGVCGVVFADDDAKDDALDDLKTRWPKARYRENPERTGAIVRQIFEAAGGKGALALHLMGTPWQIKVWQALLSIPSGHVTTYGAIAQKLSAVKASRAVGAAVGRNPVSFLIPCHRVLAGDGRLHGYHWGASRKRAMLAYEAARAQAERPSTSAML